MTNEAIDSIELETPKRPTFLTVLCILTFVVSGYHFIQALIGIFINESVDTSGFNEVSEQMYESMENMDAQGREFMQQFIDAIQVTITAIFENAVTIGIFEMLASALGIFGAILMFKLNKKGYFLYILAKVVGVVVPLIIIGVNILTLSIYGFIAVIGILFIVLYGLNTRYMH